MNEHIEGLDLDLKKLLMAYLQKWWLILISSVSVAAAAWLFTDSFITPMYTASVTVYVNNARSLREIEYISNTDLATSQRLVSTYITIIKSDTVLEKVAETSGLEVSASQIRSAMSASQVDSTEVFVVTITHPDPAIAAQLANAVAEVAPGEIGNFVEGSSTRIIDYAKVPVSPSYPNYGRNTIIGALLGFAGAVLYVTIRFMLDVRIKDEEDLMMLFDLPVLAQIPSFTSQVSKKYGGYGYDTNTEKGEKAR